MTDYLSQLPHRPPMRLVESVVDVVPGASAVCTRRARADDWYFDGHFPGEPIVPAIALIELLAQTGGLAAAGAHTSALRLAAVGPMKFPAAAGPGVTLTATARVAGRLGGLVKIDGDVTADGQIVAAGQLTLAEAPAGRGRRTDA